MQKQTPTTPAVYVETGNDAAGAQTVVKIVWERSRVEQQSFGTLAEALRYAHSLCETEDDSDFSV